MNILNYFLSPRLRALIVKEFAHDSPATGRLAVSLVIPPVIQFSPLRFALNATVSISSSA